jgi:hypothetical protein
MTSLLKFVSQQAHDNGRKGQQGAIEKAAKGVMWRIKRNGYKVKRIGK